jgi:MFS family permease
MSGRPLAASARALSGSFRNADLRRLQLAWLGSTIGNWMYLVVALPVYAFEQDGAGAVGLLWVVQLVPAALLSPVLATVADRYPRRQVMVAADLVRAALMGAAVACIVAEAPPVTVYAAAVLATVVGVVFRPAQGALLPNLARSPEELAAANAASSTIESVSSFVGPALGSLVLLVAGTGTVFALNGVSFLWSAALVLAIRSRPAADLRRTGTESRPRLRDELLGGAGAIVGERRVVTVTGLYSAQTLVAGATNVLVVVAAIELLDAGNAGVGYLYAALGAGGIIGGFVALTLAVRRRLATDFAVGLVLCGAPLVAIGLVAGLPVALLAMAVIGLGNAVVDVSALTILQRVVGDEVLGRVLGTLEGLLLASMGLGAVAAPVLVSAFGAETALVVSGLVLPVVTLPAVAALRAIDRTALRPAATELLRGVPFLGALPEPVLEQLASTATEVRVGAGETVVHEGEAGDLFYVIEAGEVEIEGRRFGPGEWFGEIALLRDVPRTATVTAVDDLVLHALERDEFLAAVTGYEPALASAEEVAVARLAGLAGPGPAVL